MKMNMKNFSTSAILLVMAIATTTACNQKEPAQQIKSNGLPKAETAKGSNSVAIVDIDSLAAQYTYCVEGQKALEAKQKTYSQQLNAKGQALQKAVADFQNKLQNGGYTSQQQAEAAQAQLQKQQQALQNYQNKIESEMANATMQYQQVLRDSLNNFIKEYNSDGRYQIILSKSGDNVLYANPAVDITNDVIVGLNKRYKK